MHHLVSIDRASLMFRRPLALCGLLFGFLVCHGCKSRVQNVSTYIGGGMMKGDPPMCFQYQGEASPTTFAANILIRVNNMCTYDVDCMVYDSVTEQQHRVTATPMLAYTVVLAREVKATRVELKLECTWKE